MKYLINLLIFNLFIFFNLFSQDLIFLSNDTIKCKILEDSITYLRYKVFNSNDTSIYKISQSDYNYYVISKPQNQSSEDLTLYNDIIILKQGKEQIKCKIIDDKIAYLTYKMPNSQDTLNISQVDYDYFIDNKDSVFNQAVEFKKEFPILIAKKNDSLIKGAYKTFYEFINNKPSVIFDFKVRQRSNSSIAMYGGTTFKITLLDDSIKKRNLMNDFWGICDGKNIYINCKVFLNQRMYSFLTIEKDDAFFYANPLTFKLNEDALIFGAIGGAIYNSNYNGKVLYRLDYQNGKISPYIN